MLATDDDTNTEDPGILPEAISIARIEDLLAQMRFHEIPKRALFSVPFRLAPGFTIGIKGCVPPSPCVLSLADTLRLTTRYGLVTEQKRGAYKYFVDLGDRMEAVRVRTVYIDKVGRRTLAGGRWADCVCVCVACRRGRRRWTSRGWCMGWTSVRRLRGRTTTRARAGVES